MEEDRLDDGADLEVLAVEALERAARRRRRAPSGRSSARACRRRRTGASGAGGRAGRRPASRRLPLLPKIRFCPWSWRFALEAEVDGPGPRFQSLLKPVSARACSRTSRSRVAAAGAEREQLHQLAGVVLVRRPLGVLRAGEPEQHRRVLRDLAQHRVERAEREAAQQLVLVQHQLLRADAVERGREPVVPDEGHPLDERAGRPHHPVEPPEVVVTPGVGRREPAALVVARLGADELLATRPGQRVDGAVEPELRQRRGLAAAAARSRRARAGARPARARTVPL